MPRCTPFIFARARSTLKACEVVSDPAFTRYRSADEDSARWSGFPFRSGDIVINTRSKGGTTWMQMICALLVFDSADLPAPLSAISPWLDWLITPRDEVVAQLEAQTHRRIIKTHTPLDGIPIDSRATYIVVARDPLDQAVSLYHQSNNLDRRRLGQLKGEVPGGREIASHREPASGWSSGSIGTADRRKIWTPFPASCGTTATRGPARTTTTCRCSTTTTCRVIWRARCAEWPTSLVFALTMATGPSSSAPRALRPCGHRRLDWCPIPKVS